MLGRAPRRDRDRPAPARPGRLPLAHAGADRGGEVVDLGRGRTDRVQGRGIGADADGRPASAGVGRPRAAKPGLREARAAGSLPRVARARADGVPLRAPGECARDPRLRGDRDAQNDFVPLTDLLKAYVGLTRSAFAPYRAHSASVGEATPR